MISEEKHKKITDRSARIGAAYHQHYDEAELKLHPVLIPCSACGDRMERIGIMYCCMNPKCNKVMEVGVKPKAYATGITRVCPEKSEGGEA